MNVYVGTIEHEIISKDKGGSVTAQANGLFNCAWAAGALVGPSLAGYLKEHYGWGVMGLVQAGLSAGMLVILLLTVVYRVKAGRRS